PINAFTIGDGMGVGINGVLYEYVLSSHGATFLPVTADIDYIVQGLYTGRTAVSSILWILGSVLVLTATCRWAIHRAGETVLDRYAGMVLIGGGCLYLASTMVQFGPLLHGPAGISIPVGVPMLMVVGYAIMRDLVGTESILR
ncbi:MAG: hypothetical protein ACP5C4_02515, partial [Methanomicrobiales archaeon]